MRKLKPTLFAQRREMNRHEIAGIEATINEQEWAELMRDDEALYSQSALWIDYNDYTAIGLFLINNDDLFLRVVEEEKEDKYFKVNWKNETLAPIDPVTAYVIGEDCERPV